MVKLELNLPWKPVLAWPWGVSYEIDPETFLVTTHKESWDIEPWEVRNLQLSIFVCISDIHLIFCTGSEANFSPSYS